MTLTIREALADTRLDPLDRRILLAFACGLSRVELVTHDHNSLSTEHAAAFEALVQRRCRGEPIAYLIGEREFYGRTFRVNPSVLIPRPETELLVEIILAMEDDGKSLAVLDLGTGSGILATTLALERPKWKLTATDVSVAALEIARANATRLGAGSEFINSDWFSAIVSPRSPHQSSARQFDLIVSNPPYIAAGDEHLAQGDLRFEPREALTDSADGLMALRTIIREAPGHLVSDGGLFLEHGHDQASTVRELLRVAGFREIASWRDLAGIERVSGGRHP